MDLSILLTGQPDRQANPTFKTEQRPPSHSRKTKNATTNTCTEVDLTHQMPSCTVSLVGEPSSPHPESGKVKHVSFQLLPPEESQRLREPMRVNIHPHDSTETIVVSVKAFHGIFEENRYGLSFEDKHGNTLMPSYGNFEHNSTVFLRRIPKDEDDCTSLDRIPSPYAMNPPRMHDRSYLSTSYHVSESASRQTLPRSGATHRPTSSHGSGVADSEAGEASIASPRRENSARAEISLDNIVEGGRRKRAKFESSELPLFAPPQAPLTASTSSLSPQRRISSSNDLSLYSHGNPQTHPHSKHLPSPQSRSDDAYPLGCQRSSTAYLLPGAVLPTPDPTINGSVISDEDVALQLMRLGDASNFSSHGRLSTSTADDAVSGKAEPASSDECDDDDDEDGSDVDEFPGYAVNLPSRHYDDADESDHSEPAVTHASAARLKMKKFAASPMAKPFPKVKSAAKHTDQVPISPASLPSTSSASSSMPTFAPDEEDLSTKPRCQRCRKSKKGCDRQRPCQRCKDAGIGIDGCVSEDEGNGRKGRYGRHMGVPVKKAINSEAPASFYETSGIAATAPSHSDSVAADKNKKRKR